MFQLSYSTIVFTNRYHRLGSYAALKILTAQSTPSETESSILRTVAQSTLRHPGKEHIMSLQDYFKQRGPNGEHGCLVFEVMGPSTASMVEALPTALASKTGRKERYPLWMAKSILRQSLLSVDFLHQSGITHGDLQPGNLLFSVRSLTLAKEPHLLQQENNVDSLCPVKRTDGKVDLWAPKYLAFDRGRESRPYLCYQDLRHGWRFGEVSSHHDSMTRHWFFAAFFTDKPPKTLVTPAGLRSPETILGETPTNNQDIWSFGCLVYEFVTGRPLFAIDTSGGEDAMNDDHFLQLFDILGPLSRDILSKWTDRAFTSLLMARASNIILANFLPDLMLTAYNPCHRWRNPLTRRSPKTWRMKIRSRSNASCDGFCNTRLANVRLQASF